jgi:CRP/FNR family transcriptional regulator
MRELCLPLGMSPEEVDRLDELVSTRRKVKRGESVFHSGEPFSALYAVRVGFFKTRLTSADGRDQVTGFFMGGELLGMDGIGTEKHTCTATALEDSDVCVIPFARLEDLSRDFEPLQRHFHKMMSREIVRDQSIMLLLGSMRAEERLAAFLLNLSQRLTSRGYSPSEFVLRMTREEIGSYLGMKLETVSRLFSRFQEDGLISVQQKNVHIVEIAGLRALLSPPS